MNLDYGVYNYVSVPCAEVNAANGTLLFDKRYGKWVVNKHLQHLTRTHDHTFIIPAQLRIVITCPLRRPTSIASRPGGPPTTLMYLTWLSISHSLISRGKPTALLQPLSYPFHFTICTSLMLTLYKMNHQLDFLLLLLLSVQYVLHYHQLNVDIIQVYRIWTTN